MRRARTVSEQPDLADELREQCIWTDQMLDRAGIAVVDVPFVTVGGGLGSFAVVDLLRVAGVKRDDIAVVTLLDQPYDAFRARAEASQLGDDDLLRSDSSSRLDNLWGFPGYALEEAGKRVTARPLARVVTEPVLAEYYNPRCAQLYEGVRREAARIGWSTMLIRGRAEVVRKRHGGGYLVTLAPPAGVHPWRRLAFRCRYVHIALGYPSLRLLPDLQEYRRRSGDRFKMVHVYEPHMHVYEELLRKPGTVLLRGAGIAASRVLERLIDDRDRYGAETRIVHLFRTYASQPTGPIWFRRPAGDGYFYQAFNFPKGAFGGQLAARVASLEGDERARFITSINGSTTPRRRRWQAQLRRGRREGWYQVCVGTVEEVTPADGARIKTTIRPRDGGVGRTIETDFIVDATGLEGDVYSHPLVADLLQCGAARLNALGRLDVDGGFAIEGGDNGGGRIYASGTIALGAPVAPVDSFFGMSQAALEIGDDLSRRGFCPRVGTLRSLRGWWGWMRNTRL